MHVAVRALCSLVATAAATAVLAGPAGAVGGTYEFVGGSEEQRVQVRRALDASRFDWSVVRRVVTIHLVPGVDSHALPGHIWIDSNLLSAGAFAWAVVQDEYAHQLDYLVLDDRMRSRLRSALGGRVWCHRDILGLRHGDYSCERFASTLVWAYWQSPSNAYRPRVLGDEAAAMPAQRFRTLLGDLLAPRAT